MKIKLANVILCEGPVRQVGQFGGPSEISLNEQRVVDTAHFIRATAASVFNRGNTQTTFSFAVHRQHNNIADAEYFFATHYVNLPKEGTLQIYCISATGSQQTLKMEDAVLSLGRHVPNGVRTYHTYTIVGGLVTP